MLVVFCLRLACGLIACLLLLSPAQVNPRFFRTHFLTALGLTAVAALFLSDTADLTFWLLAGSVVVLSFLGSIVWMLERAPGGRALILLTVPLLAAALVLAARQTQPDQTLVLLLVDNLTSAALLGTATTAMLMGHSYLIAPAMSLTPLLRLLAALGVCTLLRFGVALAGLRLWTTDSSRGTLEGETVLWLALRWGLGFVAPLVLGWLAWETAKIRSTQSATGILYVVVIFCFLGELTSQLLLGKTGFVL